jgi:hypothetical protein
MESWVGSPKRSLATLLAWLMAAATALAASLTATVDRNVVPVGESVTLNLAFEGVTPPGPPPLPAMTGLTPRGVSQSSSVTIINGQTSQTFNYNYTLAATQPGDVIIPAIQAQAGGQLLSSQPLRVRVVPQSAATAAACVSILLSSARCPKGPKPTSAKEFLLKCSFTIEASRASKCRSSRRKVFQSVNSAEPTQGQTQVGGVPTILVVFRTSGDPRALRRTHARAGRVRPHLLIPVSSGAILFFDPFGMFRHPPTAPDQIAKRTGNDANMHPCPARMCRQASAGRSRVQHDGERSSYQCRSGRPDHVKVNISGRGRLDAFKLPEQSQWRGLQQIRATKKN